MREEARALPLPPPGQPGHHWPGGRHRRFRPAQTHRPARLVAVGDRPHLLPHRRPGTDYRRGGMVLGLSHLWTRRAAHHRACAALRRPEDAETTTRAFAPTRTIEGGGGGAPPPTGAWWQQFGSSNRVKDRSCAGLWTPAKMRLSRTLSEPASKKRQGTKSREVGRAAGQPALWEFAFRVDYDGGREAGSRPPGDRVRKGCWKRAMGILVAA